MVVTLAVCSSRVRDGTPHRLFWWSPVPRNCTPTCPACGSYQRQTENHHQREFMIALCIKPLPEQVMSNSHSPVLKKSCHMCMSTYLRIPLNHYFIILIYRPKRSFGQGNIFTPVCHSVHRGGVPDQVHPPWDQVHPPRTRYTPPDQVHPPGTRYTPPGPGTPPDQVHPPGPGTPPRDQVHPPRTRYTPPGPGTPPLDQVHPPPGCKLRNTVNDRPVRILLECILV